MHQGMHQGVHPSSISNVKISVSLPDEDVRFIDAYGAQADVPSRSAVIHKALALLRSADLEAAYASSWDEWSHSEDAELWDATVADGLGDAAG